MKLVYALAFISSVSFGRTFELTNCTTQDVESAKKLSERILAMRDVGLVSTNEVIDADMYYNDVRFCAGQLKKVGFCALQKERTKEALEVKTSHQENGTLRLTELLAFKRYELDLRKFCEL